jgi:cysteine desulfurase / selenocysteine lyase
MKDIYFNNAATSFPKNSAAIQAYREVIDSLPQGIRHNTVGNDYVAQARAIFADKLNIDEKFIYFSSGATLAFNQIIFGYLEQGDHVIYDNRSHNAIVRSLNASSSSFHVEECVLYDRQEKLLLENLLNKLNYNTKLICLTHVSNVIGTIYPVEHIIQVIRKNAPHTALLVDASQSAGIICLRKIANEADFIVFPSHKHLFAPPGAAVLICKRYIAPIIYGGDNPSGEICFFSEVGTMNAPAIYSMAVAYQIANENLDKNLNNEFILIEKLREKLLTVKNLKPLIKYHSNHQIAIMSYHTIVGTPELDWVPYLKSQGLHVRGGLHCSPCIHKQFNLENQGTLRFSLTHKNTIEEIDNAFSIINEFSSILAAT